MRGLRTRCCVFTRLDFETQFDYNEFKLHLIDDVEIELCTVSRFVDGEIKVETLIDNGPKVDSAGFTQEDNFL